MIWQEEVWNIICLTNLTEGTKVNTLCMHIIGIIIGFLNISFIIALKLYRRYDNQ